MKHEACSSRISIGPLVSQGLIFSMLLALALFVVRAGASTATPTALAAQPLIGGPLLVFSVSFLAQS